MAERIIIVGAGASGLMAAVWAARCSASVTILEGKDRPGKKLLMTGNGRCNLTNTDPELSRRYRSSRPELSGQADSSFLDSDLSEQFHSSDSEFARQVIERFDAAATRRFFEELGLLTTEKNGYVYPYTGQAASVLECFLLELRRLKVKLKLSEKVMEIKKEAGIWRVRTDSWCYPAEKLILCCGSCAVPATGSDGSGYLLTEKLGLSLHRAVPALTALLCDGDFLSGLAGLRCRGTATLEKRQRGKNVGFGSTKQEGKAAMANRQGGKTIRSGALNQEKKEILENRQDPKDGRQEAKTGVEYTAIKTETGELQWTKYGISGIAVFQLSRFVSLGTEEDDFRLRLDLLPDFEAEHIRRVITDRALTIPGEPAAAALRGILPEKLIPVILQRAGLSRKQNCRELTDPAVAAVVTCCKEFYLPVKGTRSFEECQVCAGGVELSQIDPATLECRNLPGLYLAGELLDVDGPCGGYNLQWAWSSGYTAGNSAAGEMA